MDRRQARQSGIALVTELGFLAVMALVTIGIIGAARTTVHSASRHLVRAQAQAAIESALDYGAMQVAASRGTMPGLMTTPEFLEIGGFRVRVSVRSERGKVDINQADTTQLAALFRAAGVPFEQASDMADAVEDWRDGDDLVHLHGAERRQYLDAGLSYGPANRFFSAVDELRMVLGVTEQAFACVRPDITILTQAPGADPSAASPLVRRALGIEAAPENAAPGNGALVLGSQPVAPGDVYEITARLDDPSREIRRSERMSIRVTGDPAMPWWTLTAEPAQPVDDAAIRACPSGLTASRAGAR